MINYMSGKVGIAKGVTAVVLDGQQRILLHRRRDFYVWALLGGRIEPGETGEAAAVRETREETGYDVAIQRFVGEYTRPQTSDGIQRVYVGYVIGGALRRQGPETRDVQWFPLNALPLTLPTTHRIVIRDATANFPTPIKRTIHLSPLEAMTIRALRRLRELFQHASGRGYR